MNVICVIPAFNDWDSLKVLSDQIKEVSIKEKWTNVELVIVNDCSTQELNSTTNNPFSLKSTILNLTVNQGNQIAITVGLSYIADNDFDFDHIIIMDADGEDKPDDAMRLIKTSKKNKMEKIVFASRAKRNEGFVYIFFYNVYKNLFRFLTGQKINLGHFSCIPKNSLKKILSLPGIWTHFVAAIIKSKLPFTTIKCDKGIRIKGQTNQNVNMLLFHGLASMSVYMNEIILRLLLISIFIMFIDAICIGLVFYLKIFTTLIPQGWATTTTMGLAIIFVLFFLTSYVSLLSLLKKNLSLKLSFNKTYKEMISYVEKLK